VQLTHAKCRLGADARIPSQVSLALGSELCSELWALWGVWLALPDVRHWQWQQGKHNEGYTTRCLPNLGIVKFSFHSFTLYRSRPLLFLHLILFMLQDK